MSTNINRSEKATRVCRKCGLEFPNTSEFFHVNGQYLRSYCRSCSNEKTRSWQHRNRERHISTTRAWRNANRERVKLTNKEWHERNPERSREISRDTYLQRKYGIVQSTMDAFASSQKYKCANPGCDSPINSRGKESHLDHDHVTNQIRGILCRGCNQALGILQEYPARIAGLLEYLEIAKRAAA